MIKTITEVTCDICSKREVVDRTDTWGCIRLDNDKTMEICNKCGERPIRELIEVCKKLNEEANEEERENRFQKYRKTLTPGGWYNYDYDMFFTSLKDTRRMI